MRALVTGATGFVGRALVERLGGANVLSRDPARAGGQEGARPFAWDGKGPVPPEALVGVDCVFHLAGAGIGRRWTAANKREIFMSRVLGTRAVVESIRRLAERPRVLVSASAVGYYGSRGDEVLEESSPPGEGFLAEVCRAWEGEAAAIESEGVRVVSVRFGVVLGRGGGALARMATPFRLWVGGPLGSGFQWVAWVHLDDAVGMLLHAATREAIRGPMNAVAPEPARNRDLAAAIGRALRRPAALQVPAPFLRLALGEMAQSVLSSQRARPVVAEASRYRWARPGLDAAVKEALS
jgi:uncharacterized protein (TIGR01777 family)